MLPITVTHKNHKLTYDKSEEGKVYLKIDNKPMIDYQFLSHLFSE